MQKHVSTHNMSVQQTTYVSEFENVTCCDLCDRFHFLALGLSTGNVVIYHLRLYTQLPNHHNAASQPQPQQAL